MTKIKAIDIMRDAKRSMITGLLRINGAEVPVRVTNVPEAEEGKFPRVECAMLVPTSERSDIYDYVRRDIELTTRLYKMVMNSIYGIPKQPPVFRKPEPGFPKIENVIFNDPATIVFWADGTKTVVKAENEPYDPEKGLAMAISKKALGNKYDYYNVFKKWLKRVPKKDTSDV